MNAKETVPGAIPPANSRAENGSQAIFRGGLHLLVSAYLALMRVAGFVCPGTRPPEDGRFDILLTGSFHSDNWLMSHLRPLAMSGRCARIRMVSTTPLPPMEKVEAVHPPEWLIRVLGGVPARLATFFWTGIRARPDIVGGFHLLFNGLAAALLGRMIGARSLYFCVGGPAEVLDGGRNSENRLFARLSAPDHALERKLIRSVANFDLVIAMGSRAVQFFRQRGVDASFHVVSGGLDASRFRADAAQPRYDLILVGRLAEIKRIDIFLESVKQVRRKLPAVTAVVVGDGPQRNALEAAARAMGIETSVTFAGHRRDVESLLKKSRLFTLTSDSEGLSLSLMEAMLCGLPAVVSRVGDLGDLVEDGVNGYLVTERTPEAFATRFVELLTDRERLAEFGDAARRSASRFELAAVSRLWDGILADSLGADTTGLVPSGRGAS